jgi:mono/diheme cytochrome c family protein/plastocyanin
MNTSKQINIIVALVFLAVLMTGAYTMWDPSRAEDAKATQLSKTIERGAFLYSQNCRVCHGDAGEGGQAGDRLNIRGVAIAPALNRPDLQGKDDQGVISEQNKKLSFTLMVNTITCGRVGKAMPTWGQSQGGTLNDEQIRQLATFITDGTGWEQSKEIGREGIHNVNVHVSGDDSDGIKLAQALDETATTVYLSLIDPLGKGSRIEIDGELMSITANPDKDAKSVTVERGLGTTKPAAHEAGVLVYKPPVPPDAPAIVQAACGQTAPAPTSTPSGPPAPPSATLTISAQAMAFDKDTLVALADTPLTLTFDNKDTGVPHNIHFFKGEDATGETVAQTALATGPDIATLNFGPLAAGTYFYQCDVHPQMLGTLTVAAAGAGAATTPSAVEATPQPTP